MKYQCLKRVSEMEPQTCHLQMLAVQWLEDLCVCYSHVIVENDCCILTDYYVVSFDWIIVGEPQDMEVH